MSTKPCPPPRPRPSAGAILAPPSADSQANEARAMRWRRWQAGARCARTPLICYRWQIKSWVYLSGVALPILSAFNQIPAKRNSNNGLPALSTAPNRCSHVAIVSQLSTNAIRRQVNDRRFDSSRAFSASLKSNWRVTFKNESNTIEP